MKEMTEENHKAYFEMLELCKKKGVNFGYALYALDDMMSEIRDEHREALAKFKKDKEEEYEDIRSERIKLVIYWLETGQLK